jgi:hypothetical protein
MEKRCGAQTLSGGTCRQKVKECQDRCWQHSGSQCSVCLCHMGGSTPTRKLDCGHEFHRKCLDRWKMTCTGPDPTCPMCRVPFDVPTYRCRLIIQRMSDGQEVTEEFESNNIASIVEGFGIDFRVLGHGHGEMIQSEIHFDIDEGELIANELLALGLPVPDSFR